MATPGLVSTTSWNHVDPNHSTPFETASKACSYAVRVRIKVRAGKTIVSREGTGIGHGTGGTLGEAHESALKEAETDATKRALITFGNLFGLALYDKAQNGVQRAKGHEAAPVAWWTLARSGQPPQPFESPLQFCSAAKEALRLAQSAGELEALWTSNALTVAQLRAVQPELRTRNGSHYADLLENLYRQQRGTLEQPSPSLAAVPTPDVAAKPTLESAADSDRQAVVATEIASAEASAIPIAEAFLAETGLAIAMPRRIRDPAHLKYIASLPCLVCGRTPSHAHHLRFVQPRSLGSKPSDQWTVPLCPIHHRTLHDVGREEEWWQAKGIDTKAEAERLWHATHPRTALMPNGENGRVESRVLTPLVDRAANESGASTATPADSQGQPLPINLHVARPPID